MTALTPPRPDAALARGWNTWNTRSVLSHVQLPSGFALNLSFCHYGMLAVVTDAVFGTREQRATAGVRLAPAGIGPKQIAVRPGPHAYDGSYTSLTVSLGEVTISVESAHAGEDVVVLVRGTPAEFRPVALVVDGGFLWNMPGSVDQAGPSRWSARQSEGEIAVHATAVPQEDPHVAARSPAWVFPLTAAIGLSTGTSRTVDEIARLVDAARAAEALTHSRQGELAMAHAAYQACIAWDTIYDPKHRRVLTTVSRPWNVARLGYGMFCWDSFFSAWLLAPDQPQLAHNLLREVFREMVDGEFVPNVANGSGRRSWDRSQPCVGGLAVFAVHEIAPDRTLLEELWPSLLAWNRWWDRARRNGDGLLSWGSRAITPQIGDLAEILQPNTAYGATLESGMDNSPMYDDVPFDTTTHLMAQSDVGLVSLYVTDCQALARIAVELGRTDDAVELQRRGAAYEERLATLWNDAAEIFQNRRTDSQRFNPRMAPTCFYPMLAGVASSAQAEAMVQKHLLNEREFWGEWVLPSVTRDDPAFGDQHYWRGRIWAPLNFLVYLGLKRARCDAAAAELAHKSCALFETNWRTRHGSFENYNATTGQGGEVLLCDPMYPWSGLLVLMEQMERGLVPLPSLIRLRGATPEVSGGNQC